jgi:tetratricopeptide (TPR) repeat protein/uncharacterized caspase-like protein
MARASLPECRAIFSEKYMLQKHRTYLLILAAACAALLHTPFCQAQTDNASSKNWAVVIGISKYPKLPDNKQLLYADRDAQAFAAAIKKISGDNLRLLVNQDATAEAIKEALGNWLAHSATENDTVTIYFSGHGIAESEYGEAYLLAYDSDAKSPYASGVSLRELSYAISRRLKAGRILIIADAVRKDFFDAEIVGDTPSKIFSTAFNQLSQWRGGIATVLANSPGEYSREGQKWDSHGVFTKHLVDAINNGVDLNADRTSDAEEIFSSVLARVSKDTSKKQYPSKSGTTLAQMKLASKDSVAANTVAAPVNPQPVASTANSTQIQTVTNISKPAEPTIAKSNESAIVQTTPSATSANSPKPAQTNAETVIVEKAKPTTQTTSANGIEGTKTNQPVTGTAKPESGKPATLSGNPGSAKSPVPTINRGESAKTKQPVANKSEAAKTTQPKAASTTQPLTNPVQLTTANKQPSTVTPTNAPVVESREIPDPIKSTPVPPAVATVASTNANPNTEKVTATIPTNISTPPPSPLVLELESAIAIGRLVEPKGNCAWDTYQEMMRQPALTADATRLKSRLADALVNNGKAIVSNDIRSDNIADKADDFKRAGQMLAKARLLTPEKTEIATLEKLSAAAALISLQFFDEAEKALTQLPRMAATENALGIVYTGKLDNWKAERAFKNAVELDSMAAAPHYNLGLLYRSQKNEAALAEFEKAAELDTKTYAAFLAIGDEYFGQNKWQQAADAYRKAVALRPYDDNLYTKLGHALYSQGLRDEANKAYQKAKEIRSKQ